MPQPTSFDQSLGKLEDVSLSKIEPNPDNPRLTFRQAELDDLQESIRRYGVQVPIAVFKKSGVYILIDGERRWRCASKLNLKTVPALVQPEPTALHNLLLMFNIHGLREQWDPLTVALKLPRVIALLRRELGHVPTEIDLSAHTGLSRSVIRRARLLTNLPPKYQGVLLEELKKPKSRQLLSEDLFIEMEKSLRAVTRALPEMVRDPDNVRDAFLAKYKARVIDNVVDFRKISKIARAETVGADGGVARAAISRLITDPQYSIDQAWQDTVAEAYTERDIVTRIESLLVRLGQIQSSEIDDDVREKLEELVGRAKMILETEQ